MSASGIAELARRAAASLDLLEVLGVELRRVSSRHGGELAGPCPLCGGRDRLSAYPAAQDGPRAVCRVCRAWGDPLRWAMRLAGRDPDAPGETARWLRERGPLENPLPPARPRTAPRPPAPPAPPKRPPLGEVVELWERTCVPVTEDAEVSAWLRSRAIDPEDVAASGPSGLARALPAGAPCPAWARMRGRSWADAGYRLVLPLYDARGELASVRARSLHPAGAAPKAAAAAGAEMRGLALANPLGLALLEHGWPLPIVVTEGEPDHLTWATRRPDLAVLGVVAGSWSSELGARIPPGSRVDVRTHDDEAGERYASAVLASLAARVEAMRGHVEEAR